MPVFVTVNIALALRSCAVVQVAWQIIGCTMDEKVGRQLNLSWGVRPLLIMEESDVIELFNHSVSNARDYGFLKPGELVVITSGVPLGMAGTTNMIKVQTVQEPKKIATW